MQNWLENVVALGVKANSLRTYEVYSKTYIFPNLGEMPVPELTPGKLDITF